jgi:hypothetical protein
MIYDNVLSFQLCIHLFTSNCMEQTVIGSVDLKRGPRGNTDGTDEFFGIIAKWRKRDVQNITGHPSFKFAHAYHAP